MTNYKKIFVLIALLMLPLVSQAQMTPNERQARQIFDKVYNMVFGPQGSTLHYAVNIIGIYKTSGTIWMKGAKSRFYEGRYFCWNDGETYYMVDTKKKTITLHNPKSPKRDKYAGSFTFEPDNYTYHISDTPDGYVITMKLKKHAKGIREARATLAHHTLAPKSLRVKVGIFHTTVKLSNFHSGDISDDIFIFPRSRYPGYKVIDKRGEE